ncbi:MAG: hypothetical protein ACO1TE_12855 [Prosthecobacter sp.]
MSSRPKQRWGCLQWGVVGVVAMLGCMWSMSLQVTRVSKVAPQMRAVSNCKQIIIALRHYAVEHDSHYPDAPTDGFTPVSSNQIFRRLFQDGVITDERIFGCPGSGFVPDTQTGSAPGFAQTLEPGECHWMLLSGQSENSYGDVPLIIENALDTSVPPRWDLSPASPSGRGRAWANGMIVIGLNDGSAQVLPLRPDGVLKGNYQPPGPEGRNYFDILTPEQRAKLKYWDVEEK